MARTGGKMPAEFPTDAILLSAADVCARLSIGVSCFYSMRRAGQFPLEAVRLGRRAVRWRADELRRWTDLGCPAIERWRLMNQRLAG